MMDKEKKSPWIKAPEAMQIFECSRTRAYGIIRDLNKELNKKGILTYSGKVSREYLCERYGIKC